MAIMPMISLFLILNLIMLSNIHETHLKMIRSVGGQSDSKTSVAIPAFYCRISTSVFISNHYD